MGIDTAGRHGARSAAVLLTLGLLWPSGPARAQSGQAAPPGPADGVRPLAWISGCWELERGARVTTERWAGGDDLLLGTSHSTSEGRTVGWEFLRLDVSESGHIAYHAHPSDQLPTTFEAKLVTEDSVVFTNPAHDFPQSITYRRRPDSLLASIWGETSSGEREIFFPYARIPCEGGP